MEITLQDWIDALRSGKYTQVKDVTKSLKGENCFCAIGVLCEIFREKNPEGFFWKHVENTDGFELINKATSECVLAVDLFAAANIPTNLPVISWNDDEELSFDEIANRLEKYNA
jgi:hypothetical protein